MNIASLFNLAGPDLIIILLIVLLLFGARQLPELAKGMGQAIREFMKAKEEFEREVTGASDLPARERHPLKALLMRLHGGFAAAAMAPFPFLP